MLALASGIWFLIGPTLEPLWHSDGGSTAALAGSSGSTAQRVLEGIGYHYGVGAVMVMLAAFVLGMLALAPAAVRQMAPPPTQEPRRPRISFRRASHA